MLAIVIGFYSFERFDVLKDKYVNDVHFCLLQPNAFGPGMCSRDISIIDPDPSITVGSWVMLVTNELGHVIGLEKFDELSFPAYN